MNPSQIMLMLSCLPAACAQDVADRMKWRPSINFVRFYLLELERLGAVKWDREKPEITITEKGQDILDRYQNA